MKKITDLALKVFINLPTPVVLFGKNFSPIELNPAAEHLLKSSGCEDIRDYLPSLVENLQILASSSFSEQVFEQEVISKEGNQYFQIKLKKLNSLNLDLTNDEQDYPVILATFNDFTSCYKPVESALLASEKRFRDVVDASGEYIWEVDNEGHLVFITEKVFDALGYNPTELIGKKPLDFLPIKEARRIYRFAKAFGKDTFRNLEHQIFTKSGAIIWQKVAGVPLLNSKGEVIGYRGTALNITKRKVAETNLIASAERNRLLATIALRIRRSLLLEDILSTTVEEVRQFLKANRVVIYQLNPSDWSGSVVVESVGKEWQKILGISIYDSCFAKKYAALYQLGQVKAIDDIHTSNLEKCHIELLERFQVRANLAVPIILSGQYSDKNKEDWEHIQEKIKDDIDSETRLIAKTTDSRFTEPTPQLWGLLIAHQCSNSREWQQFEIDLLKQLSTQVAIAIQQSELYQQLLVELNERQKAESELMKLSRAVEQSPSMVIITNTNYEIEYVNPKFTETTGYPLQEIVGKNPRSFLDNNQRNLDSIYEDLWQTISSGNEWRGEFYNQKKNGDLYWEFSSVSSIKSSQGEITHFIAVSEDITERKWSESTIQHLAYHDALTNLPNRLLFDERLKLSLSQAKRDRSLLALMFLDLDHFKNINDTLGHTVGDCLLQQVSQRLLLCLRETDTVARMGGDEFMVLLPNISNADDVEIITEKIINALKPVFYIEEHELHITASIGISVYPYDGEDSEVLWKNADVAMYRAKEQGRDNYQHYSPTMNARALENLSLGNSLRFALEREELVVHYQPQIDLITGEIKAMEALLRWQHPKFGLIPPAKFIPIAEHYGLILKIGAWVLKVACQQNKAWQKAGLPHIPIAVNFSASQFQQRNSVEVVRQILTTTELDPKLLELEITESVVMKDEEGAIATLLKLREMGINISMDDFGTGYSSLSQLKRFPIQKMKIDRTFVRDITTDRQDAAITKVIIAMAHSLNLKAIAEGVETQGQLRMLQSMHCDEVQGFLFSCPLDALQATELLAQRKFRI